MMAKNSKNKPLNGKKLITVGRVAVIEAPQNDKCNPNSIRVLFGTIIKIYFGGKINLAADALREFGGIYKEKKKNRTYKELNTKALTGILKDEHFISYWHLESVARFLRCPTGALLLMSRFFASMSSGSIEERAALIRGIRSLADVMEGISNDVSADLHHIEQMQACFSEFQRFEDERKNHQSPLGAEPCESEMRRSNG